MRPFRQKISRRDYGSITGIKSRIATLIVCMIVGFAGTGVSQTTDEIPVPEYYGVYALIKGKLFGIGVPRSTITPEENEVKVGQHSTAGEVLNGGPPIHTATTKARLFPSDVQFLVFSDSSGGLYTPMMVAKKLRLERLTYVRNATVDTGWPNAVKRTAREEAWDTGMTPEMSRVATAFGATDRPITRPLQLLVKPAKGQSNIAIAVPAEPLTPGLYLLTGEQFPGMEFLPLLFGVQPLGDAEQATCIDVTYTYAMQMASAKQTRCGDSSAATGNGQPASAPAALPSQKSSDTADRVVWRSKIDSARADASTTPPYNGDWRSFITLKLNGSMDKYQQLYLAAVSRRSIALDDLAASERFLERSDILHAKSLWEQAVRLTIDSNDLVHAANDYYAHAVLNSAAVLNAAYRVSSQSAAAAGYTACGQPCYDGIDVVAVLSDYAVDIAIQGQADADRNLIKGAVIKLVLEQTGIGDSASSRVTHFVGQPDSVHLIVDQVLNQPQFKTAIMRTLGRSASWLTDAALSAAADSVWEALRNINRDCQQISLPPPSNASSPQPSAASATAQLEPAETRNVTTAGSRSEPASFSVRHRHSSVFNLRTSQVQSYCSGMLSVLPDGTVKYDCDQTQDQSGRCEHLSFSLGSLTQAKLGLDGSLHLASKTQGGFDFYGDRKSIKQAQVAISPLIRK